jgi:hypothetical protein
VCTTGEHRAACLATPSGEQCAARTPTVTTHGSHSACTPHCTSRAHRPRTPHCTPRAHRPRTLHCTPRAHRPRTPHCTPRAHRPRTPHCTSRTLCSLWRVPAVCGMRQVVTPCPDHFAFPMCYYAPPPPPPSPSPLAPPAPFSPPPLPPAAPISPVPWNWAFLCELPQFDNSHLDDGMRLCKGQPYVHTTSTSRKPARAPHLISSHLISSHLVSSRPIPYMAGTATSPSSDLSMPSTTTVPTRWPEPLTKLVLRVAVVFLSNP